MVRHQAVGENFEAAVALVVFDDAEVALIIAMFKEDGLLIRATLGDVISETGLDIAGSVHSEIRRGRGTKVLKIGHTSLSCVCSQARPTSLMQWTG